MLAEAGICGLIVTFIGLVFIYAGAVGRLPRAPA
jgi:hypothetical protein